MSDLNAAIQDIRQGNTAQAQKILEPIVRTDTSNISAWLWYAQTFPSQEMRLKVLVACLKFNPGNEQVLQALRLIREKGNIQTSPPVELPASPALDPIPAAPAYENLQVSPAIAPGETAVPRPAFLQAQAISRPAFDWDELEKKSDPAPAAAEFQGDSTDRPAVSETKIEMKAARQSYPFYRVWFLALTRQNVQTYVDLLDDPEAGIGRAIEWQAYVSLTLLSLTAMFVFLQFQTIFAMKEFQELSKIKPVLTNFTSEPVLIISLVGFVLVGTLFGILGLLFNGAMQNFLAHLFGGTGNLSRTVYALSAYLIPITIILSVMSSIPLVNCLSILISGYAFALNVRALQAAHHLNGGRATLIVLIPSLILLIAMCVSFVFLSTWLRDVLPNYKYPSVPG